MNPVHQGDGTLVVAFDMVKVQVSDNCRSVGINTASLAQNQYHEIANAFMLALQDELGLSKDTNVKMDGLRLNPIRECINEKQFVLGYSATVSLNIDVSTEDKKLMPQIYALASRFEAETTEVNVHGTHPYVSDQTWRTGPRSPLPWRWRCRSARGRSSPRQFICSSGWTEPNEEVIVSGILKKSTYTRSDDLPCKIDNRGGAAGGCRLTARRERCRGGSRQ